MSSGLLQVFVELGKLHGTSNYVLYWNHGGHLFWCHNRVQVLSIPVYYSPVVRIKGSRVRQTPEKGRRTYRPKRCGNNNKDEDNSLKNLNDKNQLASSQKFRQLTDLLFP